RDRRRARWLRGGVGACRPRLSRAVDARNRPHRDRRSRRRRATHRGMPSSGRGAAPAVASLERHAATGDVPPPRRAHRRGEGGHARRARARTPGPRRPRARRLPRPECRAPVAAGPFRGNDRPARDRDPHAARRTDSPLWARARAGGTRRGSAGARRDRCVGGVEPRGVAARPPLAGTALVARPRGRGDRRPRALPGDLRPPLSLCPPNHPRPALLLLSRPPPPPPPPPPRPPPPPAP